MILLHRKGGKGFANVFPILVNPAHVHWVEPDGTGCIVQVSKTHFPIVESFEELKKLLLR